MIKGHKDFLIKNVPIGDEIDVVIKLETKNNKIQRFSIVFKKKLEGYWHIIMRCDNTKIHGGDPHCHYPKRRGKERVIYLGQEGDDVEPIIQDIINKINRKHKSLVQNYQFSR